MAASEEEEAMLRDPASDLKSFQSSCDFLKSAITDIKQLKASKNQNAAEIASIQTDATIHFIHMKKLNRMSHFRCRKVREKTNEAKHQIDQCHLQLQNLLYEAMHLEKEITKCMEFKSKDEEIELVPVEDFYNSAPESISNPEVTKTDAHKQMLARLEYELEQRKQLSEQLTKTKTDKEKISQEIQDKQDYLDTLQPKLAEVLKATRPVQDYLDMPYDRIKEEHEKAEHLPTPLYVLYMQASAYQEACDKSLSVSIHGDVHAAKSLASFTFDFDEDSDSDQEETEKQDSKRRRKNQESRKLEKKNRVLKRHPLNVVFDLAFGDEGKGNLQLTFFYCMALNIVTVSVKVAAEGLQNSTSVSGGDLLSPDLILDELYPLDHGNESPNVSNIYELKRHGLQELSTYISLIGRPYLWCQWLGGLQFLRKDAEKPISEAGTSDSGGPSVAAVRAKHSVSAANMQKTITLLRERVRSRLYLLEQLSSLERGIIPISADLLKLYPAKINAHLSSWKRSTFEDLCLLPHAGRFIKAGMVKDADFIFVAEANRSSAKMTAHVVLTANCPQVPPIFILEIVYQSSRTALNDVHIKELEEEVNLHYSELLPSAPSSSLTGANSKSVLLSKKGGQRDSLLPCQVQRLLMCLDVYLEVDGTASLAVPREIPQEKMMPRTSRGPSRAKPFKFVPELGIFTHRC